MKKIFTLLFLVSTIISQAQPGSLDSTFGRNGEVINRFSNYNYIQALALQNDGKIISAGGSGNIDAYCIIARYNIDGSLDKSFATNGKATFALGDSTAAIYDVAIQTDGKILVTGQAHLGGVWNQLIVLRYNKDGSTDSSFGRNGLVYLQSKDGNYIGESIAIQPDNKILIGGFFPDRENNVDYMMVVRLLTNGKLDSSFNGNGKNFISFGPFTSPKSIALQDDGKIVGAATGSSAKYPYLTGVALFRLNANGKPDKSFGDNSQTVAYVKSQNECHNMKISASGKIVVTGATYDDDYFQQDEFVMRFNANGFVDSSFGNNGSVVTDFGKTDAGAKLVIQTNGKIVVAGSSYTDTTSVSTLVRYTQNGSLDKTFGKNGKVITTFTPGNSSAQTLVLQRDGKFITGNSTDGKNGVYSALARFLGGEFAISKNNLSSLSLIKIYPNPVNDILIISNLPSSKTLLTISNNSGNIFKVTITSSSNFNWKINDLKPGEYYLSVQNGDEKKSLLFLKQ